MDVVPTETSKTIVAGKDQAAQNAEGNEQGGQTAESGQSAEVKVLLEKVSKLEKRLDDQSRLIYKGKKTEEPAAAKPVKDEDLSLRAQIAELKAEQQKSKEQAARAKRAAARNDLIGEFISAGVHPDDAADQAELVLLRHGTRIDVDDELGQSIYKSLNTDSGEEEVVPLREWAQLYLTSERGKRLIPAKKQPTTAGIPRTSQSAGPAPALPPGHYYYTNADGRAGKVPEADIKSGKAHFKPGN